MQRILPLDCGSLACKPGQEQACGRQTTTLTCSLGPAAPTCALPLPLTVGVRLRHHHLLFPGPSPGRGASTFSPLLDDASPLGLGADFPTESGRDAGQLQVCTRRRAASAGRVCSESGEATSVSDSWLHFSPLEKRLIFTEGPCAGTEMHNISVTHFL